MMKTTFWKSCVLLLPLLAFVACGGDDGTGPASDTELNQQEVGEMMEALAAAGIAERDIQTANFSLQPVYEYVEEDKRNRRVLTGYGVSNQVTARVRDLDTLGETLDALVEAGGNTFSGLRFALDDPSAARNEARMSAMETLLARAELYAKAAGYEVGRIVTLSERGGDAPAPRPMAVMARSATAESAPTPIASGEIGYEITVNATFELTR